MAVAVFRLQSLAVFHTTWREPSNTGTVHSIRLPIAFRSGSTSTASRPSFGSRGIDLEQGGGRSIQHVCVETVSLRERVVRLDLVLRGWQHRNGNVVGSK